MTHKRLTGILGAALLAITLLTLTWTDALAEERSCRGTLGAVTVDNLRVPQGATCTLNGTRVKGTVYVERSATLRATNAAIVGNVQAENAASVNVSGGTVGGSVQVKQGGGASIQRTSDAS